MVCLERELELEICRGVFIFCTNMSKRATSDDAERDGFDVSDIHVAKCTKVHGLVIYVCFTYEGSGFGKSQVLPRGA